MRILIYGAGVVGCELAHELCKTKHEITLLARGDWKKNLDGHGLIIRHYAQLRTTVDRIKTIEVLAPEDRYDCIFVVMQFEQIKKVLPVLSANQSRYLVLVGNNMEPEYCLQELRRHATAEKEIAFGFQATGGRREDGKVISVHLKPSMTVGGLRGHLSTAFEKLLNHAVEGSRYQLNFERHMEGWLICHLAFILPIAYVCYAVDCNLHYATREQIALIFDATAQAHVMLKKQGIPIRPDGEEEYFTLGRKKNEKLLYLMAKTPFGKLAASDHCEHAVDEMKALDAAFEAIITASGEPMEMWEKLRKTGKHF